MAKPEPGENMFFGWERDKNVSDFLIVEENLRKEGMSSRANAVRYLIERVRASEAALRAVRSINDDFQDGDPDSAAALIEAIIQKQIPRE
jgi:hypothetical protein